MDILIKNINMPSEGRIINLTICSDGSVINNLPDAGGKMSSYRSERVKAVALPSHGRLCDLDSLIEHETYNIEQALFDSDEVLEDLKNAPVIVEATE